MGAKTALLAFARQDLAAALHVAALPDREEMTSLVQRVHPDHLIEYVDDSTLGDAVYPPDEIIYATAIDDVDVLCDQRFMNSRPSTLPAHPPERRRSGYRRRPRVPLR
jgi:hypothetical protein